MYTIYVHTTPDGRKYVGITSMKPNKRFMGGSSYKSNTIFYDAIKYFGWDNIKHEILETVEDKKTALKREEYYTLLFRSNEPEFGYNIYVCSIPNQESINKRSEKMKGRKQSEYTKNIISEKMKEFYKNIGFSEEQIKKMSEIKKKPIRLRNIKTKKILRFDSRESCAEFFGIHVYTLRRFINGEGQSKTLKDYKVLKTIKK